MAVYDHAKAAKEKEQSLRFEQLKEWLAKCPTNPDHHFGFGNKPKVKPIPEIPIYIGEAYYKIKQMERTIEEQEKAIKEYKKFFQMLQQFLPKQFSIHDTIG